MLLWLCNNACKRSLAICRKSRALCPVSRLLSVPIWPACVKTGTLIWFNQSIKTNHWCPSKAGWSFNYYILTLNAVCCTLTATALSKIKLINNMDLYDIKWFYLVEYMYKNKLVLFCTNLNEVKYRCVTFSYLGSYSIDE